MFNISEKYSGKDKKEALDKFKSNDQDYRKKIHPISRDLYRYYNPHLHNTIWNPNGLLKRNKYYYFIGPSNGFIDKEGNKRYEKNEINKDIINLKKEKITSFPEYKFIEENQYEIIIEYCSNCQEHQTHTFHKEELYHNYASYLQKSILLRFPFIRVLLKPIDTGDINTKLPKINNGNNLKNKFNIRIGAFEVILCYKTKGKEPVKELLYSKLEKKKFPLIMNILDKIVKFMPTFEGEIIVYEKEEMKNLIIDESNKENEKKYLRKDLVQGLEINLYLLNNEQILNLANKALEEIQNQQNPKKRLMLIKERELLNKIKLETKYTIDSNYFNHKKIRPSSSMTNIIEKGNKNKLIKSHSTFSLLRKNSVDSEQNNNNMYTDNFHKSDEISNRSLNKYIFDKRKSENLKGRHIIRKFTNRKGIINIGPLPYDSYYVEVKESKQFRNVGICLNFQNLNLYKNNYIKKYIGLFTQENAFIQIQVYEINTGEPIHLQKTKVILKKFIQENNNDINKEVSIEIKESNKSGIFEHTVPPGEYLLQVEKPNYEKSKQFITLKRGLNQINVELNIERYYNLHIIVINYEDFHSPVNNADIVIYKNSNEIVEESISDKKGEFNFLVDKGIDFLTIVVSKMDYFPVQRLFIRNSEAKINIKGEYEANMVFYLVRKKYVISNDLVLIMTYCNLLGNNFDLNGIMVSNKIINKINILSNDSQKNDGFISTIIQYKDKNHDNEETTIPDENVEESQNLDIYNNIINISFYINSAKLKIEHSEEKDFSMNGLEKYACQTIIYTPKNIFYIPSPSFPTKNYNTWFIGWLDIKNKLFYETNILLRNADKRISYFNEWLEFLQILIDEKVYSNLFEYFDFGKGSLEIGDRILEQNYFEEKIKNFKYFNLKTDAAIKFICSLFLNRNNMISFSVFKQIITSNLKNFFGNNLNENN